MWITLSTSSSESLLALDSLNGGFRASFNGSNKSPSSHYTDNRRELTRLHRRRRRRLQPSHLDSVGLRWSFSAVRRQFEQFPKLTARRSCQHRRVRERPLVRVR